ANFVEYGIGTQILKKLGITKFRVLTRNTNQKPILSGYGVEVVGMVQL
nr:bifunctional 3,4-dihydroxy-2-butanone-4-phosphate synthase/GTP cyclohydrolase II [Cloacibacterium sp.]